MPFALRMLEDSKARLGLVECMNHELLQAYPVLHEKAGDLTAHFKFTLLCMPNGNDRVTFGPVQELLPSPGSGLPEAAPVAEGSDVILDVKALLAQARPCAPAAYGGAALFSPRQR